MEGDTIYRGEIQKNEKLKKPFVCKKKEEKMTCFQSEESASHPTCLCLSKTSALSVERVGFKNRIFQTKVKFWKCDP